MTCLSKILAVAALIASTASALAEQYPPAPQPPGVALSPREREVAYPVRLPNGEIVYHAGQGGLPWLYGLGTVYGKASGMPLVNGVTPSILGSTPSGGIVPGQEPH